jgi:fluoride ion exporter CrcB/FEX
MTTVWFALAAAVGGAGRHLVTRLITGLITGVSTRRVTGRIGWAWTATVTVNIVGSFVLGVLLRHDPGDEFSLVIGTAACGSLTTFGSVVLDALDTTRRHRMAILATNVVGAVAAAALGWRLGG